MADGLGAGQLGFEDQLSLSEQALAASKRFYLDYVGRTPEQPAVTPQDRLSYELSFGIPDAAIRQNFPRTSEQAKIESLRQRVQSRIYRPVDTGVISQVSTGWSEGRFNEAANNLFNKLRNDDSEAARQQEQELLTLVNKYQEAKALNPQESEWWIKNAINQAAQSGSMMAEGMAREGIWLLVDGILTGAALATPGPDELAAGASLASRIGRAFGSLKPLRAAASALQSSRALRAAKWVGGKFVVSEPFVSSGQGQMYADLIREGVPREQANNIATVGGTIYGLSENMLVTPLDMLAGKGVISQAIKGRVIKGFARAQGEAFKKSLLRRAGSIAARRLVNFGQELIEEGFQGSVEEAVQEAGRRIMAEIGNDYLNNLDGEIAKDIASDWGSALALIYRSNKDRIGEVYKAGIDSMFEAAGPVLILSLLGVPAESLQQFTRAKSLQIKENGLQDSEVGKFILQYNGGLEGLADKAAAQIETSGLSPDKMDEMYSRHLDIAGQQRKAAERLSETAGLSAEEAARLQVEQPEMATTTLREAQEAAKAAEEQAKAEKAAELAAEATQRAETIKTNVADILFDETQRTEMFGEDVTPQQALDEAVGELQSETISKSEAKSLVFDQLTRRALDEFEGELPEKRAERAAIVQKWFVENGLQISDTAAERSVKAYDAAQAVAEEGVTPTEGVATETPTQATLDLEQAAPAEATAEQAAAVPLPERARNVAKQVKKAFASYAGTTTHKDNTIVKNARIGKVNVTVEFDDTIGNYGASVVPNKRGDYTIKLNPNKVDGVVPIHEIRHIFFDTLNTEEVSALEELTGLTLRNGNRDADIVAEEDLFNQIDTAMRSGTMPEWATKRMTTEQKSALRSVLEGIVKILRGLAAAVGVEFGVNDAVVRAKTTRALTNANTAEGLFRAMTEYGMLDLISKREIQVNDLSQRQAPAVTSEQDAAYLKAVESGDTETAQRMVDEAAKAVGYTERVWKGYSQYPDLMSGREVSGKPLTVLNRPSEHPSFWSGDAGVRIAAFFSSDRDVAERFAYGMRNGVPSETSVVRQFYINIGRLKLIDGGGRAAGFSQFGKEGQEFRDAVRSGDYDTILIANTSDEGDVWITLRPDQHKLADPVTYDDAGNVIPLSQRFNPEQEDIRYSPPAPETAEAIEDKLKEVKDLKTIGDITNFIRQDARLKGLPISHPEVRTALQEEGIEFGKKAAMSWLIDKIEEKLNPNVADRREASDSILALGDRIFKGKSGFLYNLARQALNKAEAYTMKYQHVAAAFSPAIGKKVAEQMRIADNTKARLLSDNIDKINPLLNASEEVKRRLTDKDNKVSVTDKDGKTYEMPYAHYLYMLSAMKSADFSKEGKQENVRLSRPMAIILEKSGISFPTLKDNKGRLIPMKFDEAATQRTLAEADAESVAEVERINQALQDFSDELEGTAEAYGHTFFKRRDYYVPILRDMLPGLSEKQAQIAQSQYQGIAKAMHGSESFLKRLSSEKEATSPVVSGNIYNVLTDHIQRGSDYIAEMPVQNYAYNVLAEKGGKVHQALVETYGKDRADHLVKTVQDFFDKRNMPPKPDFKLLRLLMRNQGRTYLMRPSTFLAQASSWHNLIQEFGPEIYGRVMAKPKVSDALVNGVMNVMPYLKLRMTGNYGTYEDIYSDERAAGVARKMTGEGTTAQKIGMRLDDWLHKGLQFGDRLALRRAIAMAAEEVRDGGVSMDDANFFQLVGERATDAILRTQVATTRLNRTVLQNTPGIIAKIFSYMSGAKQATLSNIAYAFNNWMRARSGGEKAEQDAAAKSLYLALTGSLYLQNAQYLVTKSVARAAETAGISALLGIFGVPIVLDGDDDGEKQGELLERYARMMTTGAIGKGIQAIPSFDYLDSAIGLSDMFDRNTWGTVIPTYDPTHPMFGTAQRLGRTLDSYRQIWDGYEKASDMRLNHAQRQKAQRDTDTAIYKLVADTVETIGTGAGLPKVELPNKFIRAIK